MKEVENKIERLGKLMPYEEELVEDKSQPVI
jgi:hypothetical protein